jgi:hypothetical protein
MKASILLLLASVLLLLGGLFAFLTPGEFTTQTLEPLNEESVSIEPERSAPKLTGEVAEDGPREPLAVPTAERTEVAPDHRPAWTREEGAKERTGKVNLPQGTPADELAVVVVAPIATDTSAFSELLNGLVSGEGLIAEDATNNPEANTLDPKKSASFKSYRVPVASDGSFQFMEPAGSTAYALRLEARYLIDKSVLNIDAQSDKSAEPTFTPSLGAWVSGQIYLPLGAAASEEEWKRGYAKVGLDKLAGLNRSAAISARAFTRLVSLDKAGRFDIFGMPATAAFGFEANLNAFPYHAEGGLSVAAGEHLTIDVHLERGVSITGIVTDSSGATVADTSISATPGEVTDIFASAGRRSVKTDAHGAFSVSGLPGGLIRITAEKDGFLPPTPERVELVDGAEKTGLQITLLEGGFVAGTVNGPDGKPLADAEVTLSFDPAALNGLNAMNSRSGATGSATTDEQGTFRISGLGKGPFMVEAEAQGDDWMYASLAGVQPGTADLKLEMQKLLPMRGVVTNTAGEPVTEYLLTLRAASLGGLMTGQVHEENIKDEEGRFELNGIKSGSWSMYVRSEGYGAAGPIDADRPGAGDEEFAIEISKGATVLGKVISPRGNPIPGAIVTWQQGSRDAILNMIGAGPTVTATSDEEGIFKLVELPAGDLALGTTAADWAKAEPVQVSLYPDQVLEDVVITMRLGGTIQGRFLSKDGEPAVGALIQIQRTGGSDQNITAADANGEFKVEHLEPGKWQVIAIEGALEGEQAEVLAGLKMAMVDVVDGEVTNVILGAAPKDPVHITGQVNPGEEVAGGLAIFIPEGEGMLGAMKMGVIDGTGKFEMDLDKSGTYVVTIQTTPAGGVGQDNVEYIKTIPSGDSHHVELDLPTGGITGRVTNKSGKALSGVRVSLYTDGGATTGTMSGGKYTESTTDKNGEYRLPHLQAGTYTVGAGGRPLTSAFDEQSDFGRVVRNHVGVGEGALTARIDFELEGAGSITGRILDAGGSPVAGASLFVRDKDGELLERISLQTSTASGEFTYGGIAPGSYTVSARGELQSTLTGAAVEVRSSEDSEVELHLEPATILRVTCVDADGSPVIANLQVLDSSGRDYAGQFGMNDLTKMLSEDFSTTTRDVGPLPPGKYKVIAVMGELSVTKPVSLKGQAVRKLKVRVK